MRFHSNRFVILHISILFILRFQTSDKQLLASPQLQRRSMSPSPRRLVEFKNKKQNSLDSNASSGNIVTTTATTTEVDSIKTNDSNGTGNASNVASGSDNGGKFENISDNGSEISDEGYRSLGLIQQANNNQSKRTSLHSQTSIEDGKADDAKTNGKRNLFSTFKTTYKPFF